MICNVAACMRGTDSCREYHCWDQGTQFGTRTCGNVCNIWVMA